MDLYVKVQRNFNSSASVCVKYCFVSRPLLWQDIESEVKRLMQSLAAVETQLQDRIYLTGDALSLADVILCCDLHYAFEKVCTTHAFSHECMHAKMCATWQQEFFHEGREHGMRSWVMSGDKPCCKGVHPQHTEMVPDAGAPAELFQHPGPNHPGDCCPGATQSSQQGGGCQEQREESKGEGS